LSLFVDFMAFYFTLTVIYVLIINFVALLHFA